MRHTITLKIILAVPSISQSIRCLRSPPRATVTRSTYYSDAVPQRRRDYSL